MNIKEDVKNMRAVKVNELIRQLRNIHKFRDDFDVNISGGIKAICDELSEKNDTIITGHISLQPTNSFGRKYAVNIICKHLDPILISCCPDSSIEQRILKGAKLWPLTEGIKKNELLEKSISQLRDSIKKYESLHYPPIHNLPSDKEILSACEKMEMVLEVFEIINNFQKPTKIRWCIYCFRRVKSTEICASHSSNVDDTLYRQAKEIRRRYDVETLIKIKYYKCLRRILGEVPISLGLDDANIKSEKTKYPPSLNSIVSTTFELDLFYRTQNKEQWESVRSEWIDLIEQDFPLVNHIIRNTNYKTAKSWENFVKEILYEGLDDRREKTTQPYWIHKILDLAENWYLYVWELENPNSKRLVDVIIKLVQQGKKQSDIAKQLNKSKQYISQTIKKYNSKEKSINLNLE